MRILIAIFIVSVAITATITALVWQITASVALTVLCPVIVFSLIAIAVFD